MNFFWYSTAPMPIARIESPNVRPYSGVAIEYAHSPSEPNGLYSHGQNKKISSSASPEKPPSRSQYATDRSARFSPLVPGTGQRSSSKTVCTPSIFPPSSTSCSRVIDASSASVGGLTSEDSLMLALQPKDTHRWRRQSR